MEVEEGELGLRCIDGKDRSSHSELGKSKG